MFKRKKRFISFLMAFIMIFGSFQIKNEIAYAQTTSINSSDSTVIDDNTTENEFEDTDLEKTNESEDTDLEKIIVIEDLNSEKVNVIDDLEEEVLPEEEIINLDSLEEDELLHSRSNLNANNILINTADDLADIALNLSGNYILGNDIDLTGFNFEPIGTFSNPFTGSLDGQNYTIRNLTINRNDEDNVGIFKYTKNSIFSNLNLENINVYGKNKVSAFVGEDNNSQFTNIKLNNIWVTGESEVGSILGYSYHGRIKNCSITGKGFITGISSNVGGLIGNLAGGLLEESYSTNCITGESYVGGLVGYSYANTIRNCYSLSKVEALAKSFAYPGGIAGRSERIENSYFAGIIFGNNREGISRGSETSCYYNDEINRINFTYYPLQKKNSEELTKQETFLNWDFENTWGFKSGFNTPYLKNTEMDTSLVFEEGTFYNPYKIENATDLLKISENLNAHYELVNDIDLSGIDFEPIGTKEIPFRGTLDGKDFTIKNLTINKPDNYEVGLFGYIKDCKIENLFMKNITVSGSGSVGGLVGTSENSELNNIHLEDVYITGFTEIGGLLGKTKSAYITKIKNISVTGEGFVNGQFKSGGIIGYINNKSILEESYSEVLVSGYSEISGLVGYASEGNILNCYSLSKVVGPGIAASSLSKAGGLLGDGTTFVTIENSYFAGEITEIANRFGLVPDAINGKVTNSYFDNTINKIDQPVEQSKTTEELKLQSNFAGWDFENIWEMNGEYPELKIQLNPTEPEVPNENLLGNGIENDPYILGKPEEFLFINDDLGAYYKLERDIDLSGINFEPIGTEEMPFTGVFDGNNHTLDNLNINVSSNSRSFESSSKQYAGFFSFTKNATIKNLILKNVKIRYSYSLANVDPRNTPYTCIGTIVGKGIDTNIYNCSVIGGSIYTVTGGTFVGGIIGNNLDGTIERTYSKINLTSTVPISGGIAGHNSGLIINCYSEADVGAWYYAGGLVGSTGDNGRVENSYFSGTAVNVEMKVPLNLYQGIIGITEYFKFPNTIKITGDEDYSSVKNVYYDMDKVDANAAQVSLMGKTSTELKNQSTFAGWDFENVWKIDEGNSYPKLRTTGEPMRIIGDYSITDTGEEILELKKNPIRTVKGYTSNDIMYSSSSGKLRSADAVKFIKGELLICANIEVAYEEVEALIKEHGGEIVGYLETVNDYQVYFENATTEEALDQLTIIFEEVNFVDLACKNYIVKTTIETSNQYYPKTDAEFTDDWSDYEEGKVGGSNWNLEAIKAPEAWSYNDKMEEVSIGVLDYGFTSEHVDFSKNHIWEYNDVTSPHGTHVAGIIGAGFDNDIGIPGLVQKVKLVGVSFPGIKKQIEEIEPDLLTIENSLASERKALAVLLENKVKVINVSMGTVLTTPTENPHVFNISKIKSEETKRHIIEKEAMKEILMDYLNKGVDFLIVTSAGNRSNELDNNKWVNSRYSDFFRDVDEPELRDRIITVGNMELDSETNTYRIEKKSCIGDRVDIFAPGTNIYSLNNLDQYQKLTGTSQAAPHVTGVAGMVFGIDPSLSSKQVKKIIVNNVLDEKLSVNIDDGTTFTYPILNAGAAVKYAFDKKGTSDTTTGTIKGVIKDLDNTIIPNQKIEIYNAKNGVLVETIETDQKGEFQVSLKKDKYILHVERNGFITTNLRVNVESVLLSQTMKLEKGIDMKVKIDDVYLKSNPLPFLYPLPIVKNNRTLVSVRPIAEGLGFELTYTENENVKEITLKNDVVKIQMYINDSKFITTNLINNTSEEHIFIDNAVPIIENEFTYLPFRSIGEALKMTVTWDDITKTANMTSKK